MNINNKGNMTATLGLVVHSAVDGVALGAAATTTHTDVEMIVFVAIMLHKVLLKVYILKSLKTLEIHPLTIIIPFNAAFYFY